MFLKTIKIFLVTILLSLSLMTYALNNTNRVFAQTLTPEQQELLDKSMEEAKILQEKALRDAQEKGEEEMDEMQKSIEESQEEFEDELDNMPMPVTGFEGFDEVEKVTLGNVLGGALLSSSIFIFFFLFVMLLALGGLVLNIFMIIDCYNREFKDRSVWLAVLIAGLIMGWGILPGVLYYFLVKKKLGPIEKKEESK